MPTRKTFKYRLYPTPKQEQTLLFFLRRCRDLYNAGLKAGLNQPILDAGWGQFQSLCIVKAERAGRRVVLVDPDMTSQLCSQCGAIVRKTLDQRWHSCGCGAGLDRDHNSAITILCRGQEVAHRATAL